jgi:hypothetical protein
MIRPFFTFNYTWIGSIKYSLKYVCQNINIHKLNNHIANIPIEHSLYKQWRNQGGGCGWPRPPPKNMKLLGYPWYFIKQQIDIIYYICCECYYKQRLAQRLKVEEACPCFQEDQSSILGGSIFCFFCH